MHPGSKAGRRWPSAAVIAMSMLVLASGVAAPGMAKGKKQSLVAQESSTAMREEREDTSRSRPAASRDRIIAAAEQRYKAQVLKAEDAVQDGRRIYILRLMSRKEGRVWSVRVDAETGKEL